MKKLLIVSMFFFLLGCVSYIENTSFTGGRLYYEFSINDNYSERYFRTVRFIEETNFGEKTYKIIHRFKSSENRFNDQITVSGSILRAQSKTENYNHGWYTGEYTFIVDVDFLVDLTTDEFTVIAGESTYSVSGNRFNDFCCFVNWIEYKRNNF